MPKLIRGDKSTDSQRREVLNVFGYRWTHENKERAKAWNWWQLVDNQIVSDADWLEQHAFYITAKGHLAKKPRRFEHGMYIRRGRTRWLVTQNCGVDI